MRVFITGASGFVGSAVTNELISLGHEVLGLARSEKSADAIANAGATPLRGSLGDLDSLRKGASESDAVINLAFNHDDFTQFLASAQTELTAIEAMGEVLQGTGRPFILITAAAPTEEEVDPNAFKNPRAGNGTKILEFAQKNIRSIGLRLPPTVHDGADGGFAGFLVHIARNKGVSGYAGDGSARWSAVHRLDAAHLFCLALENAPAGSFLQAVGDDGVMVKEIAEKIGNLLDLPVRQIPAENVDEHFGFLGRFMNTPIQFSSTRTEELLNWRPTHLGLLEDLDQARLRMIKSRVTSMS